MSEITVTQMEEFFSTYDKLCLEYDEAKAKATALYKELTDLENQAIQYFQEMDIDKYVSKCGTASYKIDRSFKVPKSPDRRELFFAYLKEKGIYDSMITCNSNSINALCRREIEENPEAIIPGIEEGEPVKRFSFRRK